MTRTARRLGWSALIALAVAASLAASVLSGSFPLPAGRVLDILLAGPGGADAGTLVVWDIRLARSVLALAAGAGLGLAGAVYQGLLRNPLADPFTLGVSTGAALGAALAIALGIGGTLGGGLTLLPLCALAGALATLGLVLLLARGGGGLERETLVLAGIVVATVLSAGIALIKALDEDSVAGIVFWVMGSLQGRGWGHVWLLLPYVGVGAAVVLRYARELDLLALGGAQARQLGVEAARVRLILLVAASLMAAAAVAVCGVIGFVGLVVPHLARLVLGAEHRPLLAASAALGGVLLLWADVLARTLLSGGAELPVGVVTALLGGPVFCLLLRRAHRAGYGRGRGA